MDPGIYGNGHLFILMKKKKTLAIDFLEGADHCSFFLSY